MIVYDTKYGDLYDKDEQTGKVSKVLRCFHGVNDDVTFNRFDYADNGNFVRAISEIINMYQCTYYLEDGSRPFKVKECKKCEERKECSHNQKYYKK